MAVGCVGAETQVSQIQRVLVWGLPHPETFPPDNADLAWSVAGVCGRPHKVV